MTGLGPYSRDQLRQTYADAWRKQAAGSPLAPVEAMIAEIIRLHPEYQWVVADADAARSFEPGTALATENPFLHMGLHVAVREQLAIDRPPGIRDLHRRLQVGSADPHQADHLLMESLAETLWEAQRAGRTPDEALYLERARARVAAGHLR